jgi:hypothetical protein
MAGAGCGENFMVVMFLWVFVLAHKER